MKSKSLLWIDIFTLSFSWVLAYWTRYWLNSIFPRPINPFLPYLKFLPYLLLVSVPLHAFFGLFEIRRGKDIEEMENFLKAVLLSVLVVMSLGFLFRELSIGRAVIFLFAVYNFIFLPPLRIIIKKKLAKKPVKIILVGEEEVLPLVYQKLNDVSFPFYNILGYVSPHKIKIGKLTYLGKPEELEEILGEKKPDEVFLAFPSYSRDKLLSLVILCEKYGVEVKLLTDLFGIFTQSAELGEVDGIPICYLPLRKPSFIYNFVKRSADIFLSIIGLAVTLPLWIIIPIAIKLDSPGPVFFIQERVGKGGKIFRMFKFRTMYKDVSPFEYAPTSPSDPRITRVGRIIRRMSLDELPQLINVLKGEMSLVGPRPEMPFIVEKYEEWQKKRLEVKPGITGLWQIMGRKDRPLHENLEYDFYYIRNRSILLDLIIILKTLPQVLLRKGAY
ncbi:sugar transferase [Candidatus Calescamantes bacterium]|nr:sugar transferase [Candidatus Calescamantes bacterium]